MQTMECYLAINKNKVLTHAATWMNPEKHYAKTWQLSERSQARYAHNA